MLTVDDEQSAVRLRQLREHGMSVSAADRHSTNKIVFEQYLETGFNYRMTDIQAAIVRVQLGKLDEIIERRRALAKCYHEAIDAIDGLRAVDRPGPRHDELPVVLGRGRQPTTARAATS